MSRQQLRIFVSSPGDVTTAREVAAQIIEKVAHEYARFFIIEPYLWEYEPMLASGHFQDSVEPPSQFDAVVLILESRLGTPMPERTAVREYRGMDGRAPVTGTEWEYEDALVAARERGVPDLLVYRSRRKAEVDTWDAESRQAVFKQMEALDAFWSRHFADHETFFAGYAEFRSLEEFAGKLENDLGKCVQRRIEAVGPSAGAPGSRLWPSAPFRGLEAYEFEHAPIFFGREEAVGSALLRLLTNAQAGRPFLLIMGASGSGKSSLVKAGVLPRLLVPQRVSGVAFLRRVTFRPGDAHPDEDLFDALARRLVSGGGEEIGLPELLGRSMGVKDLARHLRESATHPDMPFAMVLDRLAESARGQGKILRYEQARLILEVDQLEELFTSERLLLQERKAFVQLLAALVRSGLVWVIATIRADFWHHASEIPDLLALADGYGRLDLGPPSSSEVSQMIRGPAEAAAIGFEVNVATGIPLNDLMAQEAADEPGALPLLSYLLDQLYQKDIQEGGRDSLTYASYRLLGGLKGAIATRADAVIASQSPEVQQALRPVLFALVQMSAGDGGVDRAVARRAPLAEFPQGTAKRRLIEVLLDPSARLLVADALGGDESTVRLAHEALISEWATARNYVAGNAEALKTRRALEERYERWRALSSESDSPGHHPRSQLGGATRSWRSRFGREQGLLTDLDLMDARRLLLNYRDELSPKLIAYAERSVRLYRRRRQRALRSALAAAVLLGVLAIATSYEAKVASAQREAALRAQWRALTQTAAARLSNSDVPGAAAIILNVLANGSASLPSAVDAVNVFQETRAADAEVLALTGHTGRVITAVFSPDGRRIVTASWDKTARVWDARSGQQLLVLSGPDRVSNAAFSPDGQRIVAAYFDKTARVWDARSGQQLLLLRGHTGELSWAAYSPDGQRIVTASVDGTARVWDATTGRQLVVFRGHGGSVQTAMFSPDGRHIVTASFDKTARIWDAKSGQQLLVLSGHTDNLASAAFSPDGRRIVTTSSDNTARVWDATSGWQLLMLKADAGIEDASFSADARRIVTASDDGTARLWDATSGQQLLVLSGHGGMVLGVSFSPDGRHIATASVDNTARVWDANPSRQQLVLRGHGGAVLCAAFSPDGRHVVTASVDNTARLWDAASGRQLFVLSGHRDGVYSGAFSPDGRRIVTAAYDGTARVWDAASGRQLVVLTGHWDRISSAAFSPDGLRIVTAAYYDRTARVWDATSGRQLLVLNGHRESPVLGAAFSPDGRRIVTASFDKTARVWDSRSGQQLLVLRGHTDQVSSAAFSPDGRRIITASADSTARVWDAVNGRQLLVLRGQRGDVLGAAFSPDGRWIVTASGDTARVWDATSGQQLLVLRGHRGAVLGAAFSPDGRRIVTASYDGTARVWNAAHIADLHVQLEWATAAQFDPLSSTERSQLGLARSSDARRWPARSYQKTAVADPNELAHLGEQEDRAALTAETSVGRSAHLLDAFRYYASAAERARLEGWPDDAWRGWRYRRASLARVLAREGMMKQVADEYDAVLKQYAPRPTAWQRLKSAAGIGSAP